MEKSDLEKTMTEIEKLQSEVEHILYNKNPLIRFFYHRKAIKLHRLAHDKIETLFFPDIQKTLEKYIKNTLGRKI